MVAGIVLYLLVALKLTLQENLGKVQKNLSR